MEIFKGYVGCNGYVTSYGEKHLTPVKQGYFTNPDTLEEVQKYDHYAGVIAEGIVLVDVDSHDAGIALMNVIRAKNIPTIIYETTRGFHFYFREYGDMSNFTSACTPIGINIDIKVGGKGIAYLKINGVERTKIYDGGLTELPKMLMPNRNLKSTFDLEDGNGRNSILFSNMITLQKMKFSKEEIRELYSIVNEYIFKDKLPERELSTITRDDAYDNIKTKPTNTDNQKLTYEKLIEIYDRFVELFHPRKAGDKIYIYTDNGWITGDSAIRGKMLDIDRMLSYAHRTEILLRLMDIIPIEDYEPIEELIWLKNGILNINTLELMEHSPEYFIINRVNVNWNPNAYSEDLDRFLTEVSDEDTEVRAILEEVMGICLTPSTKFQKAFVLLGDKNNGKSTFLKLMNKILGADNTSALDIKDIDKQFKSSGLFGKLANIGDDISESWIDELSTFRKIVTGERIVMEFKGKDGFNIYPTAKLIFSANVMPGYKDSTGAIFRRLLLIPFTREFNNKLYQKDIKIIDKITKPEALEYALTIAVAGLQRLWENEQFSKCQACDILMEQYQFESNHLFDFIKTMNMTQIVNHSRESVYSKYIVWANTCNYKAYNILNFVKGIKNTIGLITETDEKGNVFFRDNIMPKV